MRKPIIALLAISMFALSSCSSNALGSSSSTISEETKKTYVIDFDLNGGTSSSYAGQKTVEAFTKDVFFFDCVKEDYNFRGWSYGNEKIFDENGTQLAVPTMSSKMTFTAIYSQTAKMKITKNIEEAGTVMGEGEYPYYKYVDLTATASQGYVFDGWYYKGELLSSTAVYKCRISNEDVTLEARFTLASFILGIGISNGESGTVSGDFSSDDGLYYDYDSGVIYVPYRTGVSLVAYTLGETRFLGWYGEDNKLMTANALYSFEMPNYDFYLEAKWDYFTITYNLNGGVNASDNPKSYSVESGCIKLSNPTKAGYKFMGWKYKENYVSSIDPTWMDNITLDAVWLGNKYNLSIESNDASKGTVEIISGSGYSGETIEIKATPTDGYAFNGWYSNEELISESATYSFTMPEGDYSLAAKFLTKAEAEGITPVFSEDCKTVTYGLYPQKNVNDSSLLSALNALDGSAKGSNGWYLYEDTYYAKLSASPYSSSYVFDNGATIKSGTTYWFKCEPITWDILENDNGEYYLLSSALLDAHCYYTSMSNRTINGKTVYPNNYEHSSIREWLNGDFYDAAFALGDSCIQTTAVDNSASTTNSSGNSYACNNTEDKVFLPSYKDYLKSDYGFSTSSSSSATRQCKTTDWARARGAYCHTDSSYLYNGWYWTRSPTSDYSDVAWLVDVDGSINIYYRNYVHFTKYSVRPSISLKVA